MLQKLNNAINLFSNMGWRYVRFRAQHEFLRRSGLLKNKFPIKPKPITWTTLKDWKQKRGVFFFNNKEQLQFPKQKSEILRQKFKEYQKGKLTFFNSLEFDLGNHYDWVTNPENGFKYDVSKHWTEIPDYSREVGDIKYVWEKSRFSFLYDIIRYDYHFEEDCSKLVFDEIKSWIENNPVNCGPNYRCSQEISLRVLNWIFALYYYQDADCLTEDLFSKIQHNIYWQLHHVYHNIDFSRIAVRNNHAITETLTLYIASLIFPGNKDIEAWGKKGKKWFEEEIAYQVYEDGTFLQFSMNYHRVVIQLLTWAIHLSELNNSALDPVVYDRARSSLRFLRVCMDDQTGRLPNYGANDGALFFKLSDAHYRDYRPQLQALAAVLNTDAQIEEMEDRNWYGISKKSSDLLDLSPISYQFRNGGYYIFRERQTLTFIRCGNHKDRPSQADNLHLDIWYNGENILQDAGSYKYNTDGDLLKYFMGTRSHNTVMIEDYDQMQKGGRFIWYKWSQCLQAGIIEENQNIIFTGTIAAFQHLNKQITHTRTVTKTKGKAEWTIKDTLENVPHDLALKQLWHLPYEKDKNLVIIARTEINEELEAEKDTSWYAGLYGQKEKQEQYTFVTKQRSMVTTIRIQ